jgi:F-type H+-transporting ATPase subunit delta
MISTGIFARYSKALADVALETGQEAEVGRDLATYQEIFVAVPDLLVIFDSPAVQRETKERILDQLLGKYPVGATTGNFLRMLLRQNRIRYFREIIDYYTKYVNTRKGIVAAQVTVASPLSEQDLEALRTSLGAATGNTVVLDVKSDPELLGGLVVQIGSTVYDGSIRRQLSEMRERLSKM